MGTRGQTMPFWLIAITVVLGLTFFVASYVNTIAWQIHAQNAADSAASAGLSVHANVLNEESTLLYAAAVDEYRIRAINQAMLNAMNGTGGCAQTQTCAQDYAVLLQEYQDLVAQSGAFAKDIQLLRQADNFTQGGQQNDERKAIQAFGNCGQPGGGFDCAFTYNVVADIQSGNGNGKKNMLQQVDVIACRVVPYFAPALYIMNGQTSFMALGRSAAAVVPVSNQQSFAPGQPDPMTGQIYQPVESAWNGTQLPDAGNPLYVVDFKGLAVNTNWYTAGPVKPFGGTATHSTQYDNVGNTNGDAKFGCTT